MTESIKTTGDIRSGYADAAYSSRGIDVRLADFDKWLEQHDADVIANFLVKIIEIQEGLRAV